MDSITVRIEADLPEDNIDPGIADIARRELADQITELQKHLRDLFLQSDKQTQQLVKLQNEFQSLKDQCDDQQSLLDAITGGSARRRKAKRTVLGPGPG